MALDSVYGTTLNDYLRDHLKRVAVLTIHYMLETEPVTLLYPCESVQEAVDTCLDNQLCRYHPDFVMDAVKSPGLVSVAYTKEHESFSICIIHDDESLLASVYQ